MVTSPAEKLVSRAVALLAAIERGAAAYGLEVTDSQILGIERELDQLADQIARIRTALVYDLFEEPVKDPTSTDAA